MSDLNLNILNQANLKANEFLKKKTNRLEINKSDNEELSSAYSCNSNEAIIFKIVHSEEEFKNFQNLSNLENSFHPNYTNQLFAMEETINGYKNLKILISITPKFWYPHVKIIYEKCLKVKDDVEGILKNHFEHVYEKNDNVFLKRLEQELKLTTPPKGKLITNSESLFGAKYDISYVDTIADYYEEENFNLQSICTFFIDGASFIPFREHDWFYFTLYDKNHNLIGFSTVVNKNLSIDAHRSMVSQFLIIPPYQRKGLGNYLLDVKIF
jgi:histone acetyltransferase 1